MSFKQKTAEIFSRHIREYIDSRFDESYEKHCKDVFQSETFAHLNKLPNADKVNDYVTELMTSLRKEVYVEHGEEILKIIDKEMGFILDELFTEPEAQQLYEFVSSDLGKKLFRNTDLFREAFAKGNNVLVAETVKVWSKREVAEAIFSYIQSLEDEE